MPAAWHVRKGDSLCAHENRSRYFPIVCLATWENVFAYRFALRTKYTPILTSELREQNRFRNLERLEKLWHQEPGGSIAKFQTKSSESEAHQGRENEYEYQDESITRKNVHDTRDK